MVPLSRFKEPQLLFSTTVGTNVGLISCKPRCRHVPCFVDFCSDLIWSLYFKIYRIDTRVFNKGGVTRWDAVAATRRCRCMKPRCSVIVPCNPHETRRGDVAPNRNGSIFDATSPHCIGVNQSGAGMRLALSTTRHCQQQYFLVDGLRAGLGFWLRSIFRTRPGRRM